MENLSTFLTDLPVFSTLSQIDKDFITRSLKIGFYSAGEVIFKEGEKSTYLYIIVEGTVEIIKALGTEDEIVITEYSTGEIFGEMSAFNEGRRSASVRAATLTRVIKVSHVAFHNVIQKHPTVIFEMVTMLSTRLDRAHNTTILELRTANQELQRINRELIEAQEKIIRGKKLERELEIAYEIQMSILPSEVPESDDYDFGVRIKPARQVGGDLYDFIELDDRHIGVIIGDVSDKGVPAAIFMAQTRALMRAEATQGGSPEDVLREVNRHLLNMNAKGLFVTAIYGVLDLDENIFVYARAGHELPLMLTSDGDVLIAEKERGQLLGVIEDFVIEASEIELPPQSTLLLYTDGGTDVRGINGEEFGVDRLHRAFSECEGMDAQATVDHILGNLEDFQQDTPQFDDITLVTIRRR